MPAANSVRRYALELGAALIIYGGLVWAAMVFEPIMQPGPMRLAVSAGPVLGVLLALWAVVRQQRRVDEYIRLVTLQNIAISAAVTAGWTLTYGFLENAGLPRLSMFVVWPVMGGVWGAVALMRGLCGR